MGTTTARSKSGTTGGASVFIPVGVVDNGPVGSSYQPPVETIVNTEEVYVGGHTPDDLPSFVNTAGGLEFDGVAYLVMACDSNVSVNMTFNGIYNKSDGAWGDGGGSDSSTEVPFAAAERSIRYDLSTALRLGVNHAFPFGPGLDWQVEVKHVDGGAEAANEVYVLGILLVPN